MKHRIVRSTLLSFLTGFAVASANAESLAQSDIPLGAPNGFSATAISAVGSGRYCVSGFVYDDAGPSESAYVLLVDANSRRVIWRTSIPHGHDYVSNSVTRCMSEGSAYYAITRKTRTARDRSIKHERSSIRSQAKANYCGSNPLN